MATIKIDDELRHDKTTKKLEIFNGTSYQQVATIPDIANTVVKVPFSAVTNGQTLFVVPVPLGKTVVGFFINNIEQDLTTDYTINYLPTQTELTWNNQFPILTTMNLKISYI